MNIFASPTLNYIGKIGILNENDDNDDDSICATGVFYCELCYIAVL